MEQNLVYEVSKDYIKMRELIQVKEVGNESKRSTIVTEDNNTGDSSNNLCWTMEMESTERAERREGWKGVDGKMTNMTMQM